MTDCKYTVLSKDAFPSRFFNGEVSGECIKAPRMMLGFKDFALNLTHLYLAVVYELKPNDESTS